VLGGGVGGVGGGSIQTPRQKRKENARCTFRKRKFRRKGRGKKFRASTCKNVTSGSRLSEVRRRETSATTIPRGKLLTLEQGRERGLSSTPRKKKKRGGLVKRRPRFFGGRTAKRRNVPIIAVILKKEIVEKERGGGRVNKPLKKKKTSGKKGKRT